MQKQTNKGFTLVELAIVLVIIGLLIGGILKGQQLMQNSRITATVSQMKAIEAATTNFYDVYGEKPGDLQNPDTRIKNCSTCGTASDGFGNGKVGPKDWDMTFTFSEAAFGGMTAASHLAENLLFWYELLQTGLIGGVTDEVLTLATSAPTFGGTFPGAQASGGFWVGNLSGAVAAADTPITSKTFGIRGTVLRWIAKPTGDGSVTETLDAGYLALSPAEAANVDRKMDDGLPNAGNVEGYGPDTFCISADGTAYQENVTSKDCGLVVRIFK